MLKANQWFMLEDLYYDVYVKDRNTLQNLWFRFKFTHMYENRSIGGDPLDCYFSDCTHPFVKTRVRCDNNEWVHANPS